MAKAVQAAGSRFLDAPMTRTPKEAAEGRLNLLVGGDAALLRGMPAAAAPASPRTSPTSARSAPGISMKLLHNYVSLGLVALLAEAAACARRIGVAAGCLRRRAGQGRRRRHRAGAPQPFLLRATPPALRFSMANARKDLDYYQAMAADIGAADGIAQAVLQTFAWGLEAGGPQSLVLELVPLLERKASSSGGGRSAQLCTSRRLFEIDIRMPSPRPSVTIAVPP